jgi:uncharacterized protein (DUF885 family)
MAEAEAPGGRVNRLFDVFMKGNLDASPEETTALGLDVGERVWAKSKLNDRSLAFRTKERQRIRQQLSRLATFDRASLSAIDQVNYDVVLFTLQAADAANSRYDYAPVGAGIPYTVSQLTGAYLTIPDFLDAQHQVASHVDADAYLSRLAAFGEALDQESEAMRHDAGLGCTPPDFILARALPQLMNLRRVAPENSSLVSSLVRRAKEHAVPGDYLAKATRILRQQVYPALDRQIDRVRELQTQATHEAGVWKFRDGDAYYVDSIVRFTGSSLLPSEIHQLGLEAVAKSAGHIDQIMRQQGLKEGNVGERLRGLFNDPRFRYPNTEDGKAQLLADLNRKVQAIRARLPQYFGLVPQADVVVKRVPSYMESGRISGYYQPPSLDALRPGAFYINLRDTAEAPTWKLPTYTYHESIPGHHLKFSLYQEANLPLIRKIDFYGAYLEGWSLYAEQLADEMQVYADDPFGKIGYLHSVLRASVALVIDTGLHAKRWTREEGIRYFTDHLGDPVASATTEVERYCVWPGQVCSYFLDNLTINRLRDRARAALGSRFDIRQFHDAILLCGAAPQKVLEMVVDRYVRLAWLS